MQEGHRHGPLKQENKGHKSPHASKRDIRSKQSGRIETSKSSSIKDSTKMSGSIKANRLNEQKQIRDSKMRAALQQKKFGPGSAYPAIVALIPLSDTASVLQLRDQMISEIPDVVKSASCMGVEGIGSPVTLVLPTLKKRMTVLCCSQSLEMILDVTKVADYCVYVTDVSNGEEGVMNDAADLFLSAIRTQGFPTPVCMIQGLDKLNQKEKQNMRKYSTRLLQTEFGVGTRIFEDDKSYPLIRSLVESTNEVVNWRNSHSYMLVDTVNILNDGYQSKEQSTIEALNEQLYREDSHNKPHSHGTTTVEFCGYLRGIPMNVHDLVHVTSESTHCVSRIVYQPDPLPLKAYHSGMTMPSELSVEPEGFRLQMLYGDNGRHSHVVNTMDGNDPTDSMTMAPFTMATETSNVNPVGVKTGDMDEMSDHMSEDVYAGKGDGIMDEDMDEDDDMGDDDDDDMDDGDELKELEAWKRNQIQLKAQREQQVKDYQEKSKERNENDTNEEDRAKEEKEYFEAPDEIESPYDVPARIRFSKYRGLESFRRSPWDPNENLPAEYSQLFEFDNFASAQKSVEESIQARESLATNVKQSNDPMNGHIINPTDALPSLGGMDIMDSSAVPDLTSHSYLCAGSYVRITIHNLDVQWVETRDPSNPVILSWLLPHEHRKSVVHAHVQRSGSWFKDTLKSRDLLVCSMGFRRFYVRPLFSDAGMNCDKNKYVKYVGAGDFTNCSFYGPIAYKPSPVLLFRPSDSTMNTHHIGSLVATGSLSDINPNRIILKKIILSGNPFKSRKRLATVRFMFYSPEDIDYFSKIQLITKKGKVGHIKESLGTHGYMKCLFNEQINMQDVVRMYLYKRVYPKMV